MNYRKGTRYQIGMNILWGIIAGFLGYGISFFITPYISEELGIEAYGFISLANTLIGYVDIIAVAINAFAARNIAICYHNGDYLGSNEYYSSVLIANIIFAIITSTISFAIIFKLEHFISIPSGIIIDVKILFLLVLLNYVINLIANVYSLSAFIKNYSSISSRNSGIGKIIYALIIFVVIYSNTIKVYSTVVASVVSSIFILLTSIYYAKKITPELKINIKCFNFNKVKTLLSSGIWNSINNIGNLLNSGLDLLLSNQLLSSVAMGEISIVKQISNIVTSVSFMISNAFRAKQLEAYSKNNIQKLVDYLVIAMKCMGIIGGVLVAGFVALGKQFYMTWLPSQDAQLLYRLTVIVMVGEVLVIVVRPLYYVNTLTDKLKIVCWMTILNGILNVIGMIVLIKLFDWKSYAIVVTTMVLNFIQALIVTPILESYFLKLKDKFIFSKIVIRYLLITTLCTLIIYAISLLLNTGAGWKNLIFNAIILGGVGFIIMVLGELEPHEIKRILKVKK